jgi:hypothetical protein
MKNTDPQSDHTAAVREALQRDAARVQLPIFDAALHYATMRRIRSLTSRDYARPLWWKVARPAVAVIVTGMAGIFWYLGSTNRTTDDTFAAASTIPVPRATAWSYQQAAAQGNEAFLAALDRDARTLLPPSAPVFSTHLN